jgi:hypothetical protein
MIPCRIVSPEHVSGFFLSLHLRRNCQFALLNHLEKELIGKKKSIEYESRRKRTERNPLRKGVK